MTTIYHGYADMQTNKIETLPYMDLEQSKAIFKQLTQFNPNQYSENRFSYTGTEINQIKHQTPFLQRSIIENFEMPTWEYYNRFNVIQPRPDYVINCDTSDSSVIRLFKKEQGII